MIEYIREQDNRGILPRDMHLPIYAGDPQAVMAFGEPISKRHGFPSDACLVPIANDKAPSAKRSEPFGASEVP